MPTRARPYLMFDGKAEEAINLYVALFPDSEALGIIPYDDDPPEMKGKVLRGGFRIGDQIFMCMDSPVRHDFGFTPAFSIYVDCESAAVQERLFANLKQGGEVLMPLDNYGFSERFGWLNDRFGVSWQLDFG